MKKALLFVILISLFATFGFAVNGAGIGDGKLTWAGWDTIVYGWPTLNGAGQITSIQGISLIGYAWRNYFNPMEPEKVNFYWEAGLNAAFLGVEAGVGLTYPLPLKSGQFDHLYLTGGLRVTISAWSFLTGDLSEILYDIIFPYPWIGAAVTF
ncbi:MAG: hypothetical protein U9O65_09570 [Thermotogota bacterium]|nr:hypothetical protein [Thermotogota bacterium]